MGVAPVAAVLLAATVLIFGSFYIIGFALIALKV